MVDKINSNAIYTAKSFKHVKHTTEYRISCNKRPLDWGDNIVGVALDVYMGGFTRDRGTNGRLLEETQYNKIINIAQTCWNMSGQNNNTQT